MTEVIPSKITKSSDIKLPNDIELPNSINEDISKIYERYYNLTEIFICLGYIKIDDKRNQIAYKKLLKSMFHNNKFSTTMQILGYCAEAVIVRRCNKNPEINKKWLDIAYESKDYDSKILDETIAIGTGHYYTKIRYPYSYSPNDTQRDIIWINKENEKSLVSGAPFGDYIGLQVKTSIDSSNNIKNDLLKKKYCVPIVYFDISNDWRKTSRDITNCYNGCLYNDFVSAKDIDVEAYNEVSEYSKIIDLLYNEKITVAEFMYIAFNHNNLCNATLKAITSSFVITHNNVPLKLNTIIQ